MKNRKTAVKSNTNLFFSGVVVLTAANLLVKVIGLLFKIPMTNKFGDEVMGYYNSAYSIYTFFYMISTAGLPVAVSIMISDARAKGRLNQIKRIFGVTVGLFFQQLYSAVAWRSCSSARAGTLRTYSRRSRRNTA